MISNKSLRSFQELKPIVEERERAQARAEIETEMDAVLAAGQARRDAEAGREMALRDTRQAKAREHIAEVERRAREDRTADDARRVVIRAQVEREFANYDAEIGRTG